MRVSKILIIGLAIFSMLFGAGNVVFPLILGRLVGNKLLFALPGLFITAVGFPLIGLIAALFSRGHYHGFLRTSGKVPGVVLTFFCMMLIGPFGSLPRCISLSYAVMKWHAPSLSIIGFSLLACIFIFLCTYREAKVVDLLGRVFGPIKLMFLLLLVVLGVLHPAWPHPVDFSGVRSFISGLREGYWTFDLIGTILFSRLIVKEIIHQNNDNKRIRTDTIVGIGLRAGLFAGLMLCVIFGGFVLIAAMHGSEIFGVRDDQLLSALAIKILGPSAGFFANFTVAFSCLSTAIALTAMFTDYLRRHVFSEKIRYISALLITISMTFVMATLGFDGIMKAISPLVLVIYPTLLVLCLTVIAKKVWAFEYVKVPTAVTFLLSFLYVHWR